LICFCRAVTPDDILGVSHLNIDFKNKVVTRAGAESEQRSSIEAVEAGIDGKLILSGIEDGQSGVRDGAGWTISIMDPEGTMVLAVAGDGCSDEFRVPVHDNHPSGSSRSLLLL